MSISFNNPSAIYTVEACGGQENNCHLLIEEDSDHEGPVVTENTENMQEGGYVPPRKIIVAL